MAQYIEKLWKAVLIWFAAVMLILSLAHEWSVVLFGVTYGLAYGGLIYRARARLRSFLRKLGLNTYPGFLLLSILVTVSEEIYCYVLGNRIAHPVLWIDLVMVSSLWTVWFGTWYFYLSKKYDFTEKEALITAGSTGLLYEFVGTGYFLQNPFGIILAYPLAVVVYSALFILPMQVMDFTGTTTSKMRYPVGVVLPFLLTIPAALVVFVGFSFAGHPLN